MKRLITVLLVILPVLVVSVPAQAQRARGGRGAGVPEATGDMLNLANQIAAAVNARDTDALTAMLTADAVYLDEDGHAVPPAVWAMRMTTGEGEKHIEISSTHSQTWDDTGWVSFNFTFTEAYQGQPASIRGIASVVAHRIDGAWKIAMIHGAFEQHVAGFTN